MQIITFICFGCRHAVVHYWHPLWDKFHIWIQKATERPTSFTFQMTWVTQGSWLSEGHSTRSLNKEASMFCSGEAAVNSDFSLFRYNMCSRQILGLHKLVSQLVIISLHHFFSPIVFFIKLSPLYSTTSVCYNIDKIRSQVNAVRNLFQNSLVHTGGFFSP